jgi:hypothetical protein
MRNPLSFWWKLLAVVVVATGIAVVWGMAAMWVATLAEATLRGAQISEGIQIAADGTPVISTQARKSGNYAELSRRTLDGKLWPSDYENWIYPAWLDPPPRSPGLFYLPIYWSPNSNRIVGVTDYKHPPTDWYAVHDGQPEGHMYFAGYDTYSQMPVGFIGTQGFQDSLPDISRQFSLRFNPGRPIIAYFAGNGMTEENRIITYHGGYSSEARLAPWLKFVVDHSKLWQIDLRARTAEVVLAVDGTLGLNDMSTLESIALGNSAEQANRNTSTTPVQSDLATAESPASSQGPSTLSSEGSSSAERPKRATILTILTDDRIVLFDPPTRKQWEFKLSPEAARTRVQVYWIHPDELLLTIYDGYWAQGPVMKLLWVKADGTIARRERLELHGWTTPSPEAIARRVAAAVPVPVVWFTGMLAGGPAELIQENMAPDYVSALRQTWGIAWLPFVVVLVVSLPAVWIVRRWQRQYRRPNTAAWSILVFLLGPLGLAAYRIEHRRAKLERCGECGHVVPRDRETCAACHSPFPAPPLVGTEIFA